MDWFLVFAETTANTRDGNEKIKKGVRLFVVGSNLTRGSAGLSVLSSYEKVPAGRVAETRPEPTRCRKDPA